MIIKIDQAKTLKSNSDQLARNIDIINVFAGGYSDNLKAYFLRSKTGTALFVNENLTPADKARAIKIVKDNINKCGISEMGLINGDWVYKCGGTCCKNKETLIEECD